MNKQILLKSTFQQLQHRNAETLFGRPVNTQLVIGLNGVLDLDNLKSAVNNVLAHNNFFVAGVANPTETPDLCQWHQEVLVDEPDTSSSGTIAALINKLLGNLQEEPHSSAHAQLLRVNDNSWQLLWSLPGDFADAISAKHLFEQLTRGYAGASLPEAIPYQDYVEWQGQHDELQISYWDDWSNPGESESALQFKVASKNKKNPLAVVSATFNNPEVVHYWSCESELRAAWLALVGRLSADTICTAVVVDGRVTEELEDAIGPYALAVPHRITFNTDQNIDDIAGAIDTLCEQAFDAQVTFPGDNFTSYCADSSFQYVELPGIQKCRELQFELTDLRQSVGHFNTQICVLRRAGELNLHLYFNENIYSHEDMHSLLQMFSTLLEQNRRDVAFKSLELVSSSLRQVLVTEYNATRQQWQENNICQMIEYWAETAAEKIAVADRNITLTFGELNARANQLANWLGQHYTGELRIGICMENSASLVVALYGILKAGFAYVPIDPGYPHARKSKLISHCTLVLQHGNHLRDIDPPAGVEFIDLDSAAIAQSSTQRPLTVLAPETIAYVLFTSGSTGQPKGVVITHDNLLNYIKSAQNKYFQQVARSIVHTSIGFDLTVTSLFLPLVSGGYLDIIDSADGVEALKEALLRQDADVLLKLTPAHLKVLKPWIETLPRQQLAIGVLVVGGEQLFSYDLRTWFEKIPALQVFNEYGPTETTVGACHYLARLSDHGAIPIGQPQDNTQIYVLDRYAHPVATGVIGEIYIGGRGVARGYLANKEQTEKAFIDSLTSLPDSGNLYRTGDLACFTSAFPPRLEFIGRADTQVKVRGYRIELEEIEIAIRHLDFVEDVVVDVADVYGSRQLIAVVRCQGQFEEQIRTHLAELFPLYMIPERIQCVSVFPLNVNGKVDRKALVAAQLLQKQKSFQPATSAAEIIMQTIWCDVLEHKEIGVNENFFDLGGDSIRAVYVVSLAKEQGYDIAVHDIFQKKTIERLCENLTPRNEALSRLLEHTDVESLTAQVDKLDESQLEALLQEID